MDGVTAGRRAAEQIIRDKVELAREITDALYVEMPELMERHGDYGRAKCHEDMLYNLEHLAPAVDLEEPEMFASYVRWLDGMLRARGVGTDEVARSLEITERVLGERLEGDESRAAVGCVRAGLEVLATPGAS